MTARHRAIHRQDSTAKALIAEATAYGAKYLPLDGVVDGVLFFRGHAFVVDWKGPKTKLTKRQSALLAAGHPIWFIRDSQQLRDLLFGQRRDA
jgi:hypothetical protein